MPVNQPTLEAPTTVPGTSDHPPQETMADDKIEDANAKLDLSSPVDATKPPAAAVSQSQDLAM